MRNVQLSRPIAVEIATRSDKKISAKISEVVIDSIRITSNGVFVSISPSDIQNRLATEMQKKHPELGSALFDGSGDSIRLRPINDVDVLSLDIAEIVEDVRVVVESLV